MYWRQRTVPCLCKKVIESYLNEINLPENEIHDLTDQIVGGNMNRLFEHFEEYDVQAMRKKVREEFKEEIKGEVREEFKEEIKGEVREELLVEQVVKKIKKGLPVSRIAAELEEDEARIQGIVDVAEKYAPDYDVEKIVKDVLEKMHSN